MLKKSLYIFKHVWIQLSHLYEQLNKHSRNNANKYYYPKTYNAYYIFIDPEKVAQTVNSSS